MKRTLMVVATVVTVFSGGWAERRAAAQETEAAFSTRPARSPAFVERRRCVGQATESCYNEYLDDRQATTVCLPVRISACELAYRGALSATGDQLASAR
jgi:hypothetical protein